MTEKITLAVVGTGSIARKAHLPVLAIHPGVEIVGLCSRTGSRVAELAAQYRLGLRARTFEEVLAVKPQAAYLLSATVAHPEQAEALLEAGIAVYMEKPLANDVAGARRIAAAVERTGGLLMVGFNRRYAPAYRRALELFAGRKIEFAQVTKHRNGDHSGWPMRQVIMDDAIHIIDLARHVGGSDLQPLSAYCRWGLTTAQLVSSAGTVVHLSQTYGAGAPTERLELHGEGLTVLVEEMERLVIREGGKERMETVSGSWTPTLEKRGMAPAAEHFLSCVRTGARPATDVAEAFRTQELAEAILVAGAAAAGADGGAR
jgi:virulence factor